ncbi:hypothetical protein PCYB_007000 [Plasmodium cynomolgi strain B]|uniref:CYIR protein n=1 Tax=Plasmodium cynomolgi (strain B) TaxID=1120755 RepID=K6UFE3_PLACD|nr:hypothetical protein PCYB_007000 [Plasmodium cynomolgi strain B]GAB69951.1 hypothetical protein PCYB_007000 [Plasmodium cynomolgi strain B]
MDMDSKDLHNHIKICSNIKVTNKVNKSVDGNVNEMVNQKIVEVRKICTKFLRYLAHYALSPISNPKYDECILLNFWIYSRLDNILESSNHRAIIHAFISILQIWNQILHLKRKNTHYKICHPDSTTIFLKDWKERKELYDYYVNYDTLFLMAKFYETPECTYYKEIKEKQKIFDKFKRLCDSSPENCPNFFEKCKPYEPNIVISNLNCHKKLESEKGDENTLMGFSATLGTASSVEEPQDHAIDIKDYIEDNPDTLNDSEDFYTQLDSENSGIGTKVTHSILGAAPVLLTGTVLYRVCIYFVNIYHYSTNL